MRDLKLEIQNKIQVGLQKFGTVRKDCMYHEMGVQTYDVNTGAADNPVISSHPLKIIFTEFDSSTVSGDLFPDEEPVRLIDRILIFSKLDLSIKPKVQDVVTDDLGVNWRIMGVGSDPADAHFSLHGRPIDE